MLEHSHAIYFHIACDCFSSTVAKLSSYNKNHVLVFVVTTLVLYRKSLVLYRKSLPTSGLEVSSRDQWNAKKSPSSPKEGNERRKELRRDGTNSRMVEFNSAISLITLNVNGLNTAVKSTNCQNWSEKRPSCVLCKISILNISNREVPSKLITRHFKAKIITAYYGVYDICRKGKNHLKITN